MKEKWGLFEGYYETNCLAEINNHFFLIQRAETKVFKITYFNYSWMDSYEIIDVKGWEIIQSLPIFMPF